MLDKSRQTGREQHGLLLHQPNRGEQVQELLVYAVKEEAQMIKKGRATRSKWKKTMMMMLRLGIIESI